MRNEQHCQQELQLGPRQRVAQAHPRAAAKGITCNTHSCHNDARLDVLLARLQT